MIQVNDNNRIALRLKKFLKKHLIGFKYCEHPAVFTVEQSQSIKSDIPGAHTKNLFLTDRRGQYYLVCIQADKRLAINQFRREIGAKKLSFASPEDLQNIL